MYPHRSNLLFAMPLTGRPLWPDLMFAFHSMAMPMNYNVMHLPIPGKPVDEARNIAAHHAKVNDVKYIFFWDEDVACPGQTIPELVYKMEHTPDAAVIGGVYCLKRNPAEPLLFRGNGNGPYWDWKAGEFFEVSGIGMGCTMIRVDVFDDLKKPWFKTQNDYSRMMEGTGGLEMWTEDLWFCKRVTDTGKWKVYVDTSIICGHYDMNTGKRFDLPPDSKPMQRLQVPKKSKKVLDIGGSGYTTDEGPIVTANDEEHPKPDYRCDLRRLPFDNGYFDIVFSSALERYESHETSDLIKEWARVLKPDGELRLVASNTEWLAKQFLSKKISAHQLYGKKRQSAFTPQSLTELLEEFTVETVGSDPAHIGIRATRR